MAYPTISYTRETAIGYPGMIATTEGADSDISLVVESTSGDIPFGSAMVFGALAGTVKLPTAGGNFAGIAVADRTQPFSVGNPPVATATVFKPYDQLTGKRAGSIFVMASVAVAQGDPVYFVNAGGALTNVVGSGATAATLISGAEWVHPTTGAGLSRIRLSVSKS